MKQFLVRHKRSVPLQAIGSASILSLFVFAVLRCLFYEFPMTWGEEIVFFMKTFLASCFVISTATIGSAFLYNTLRNNRTAEQMNR